MSMELPTSVLNTSRVVKTRVDVLSREVKAAHDATSRRVGSG